MKKRYLVAGGILFAGLFGLMAVRRNERARAAERPAADSVAAAVLSGSDVATARRADLISGLPVSGTLEPSLVIRIASPIPEVVEEVFVKEGESVHRGQALARFRTSAVEPAALSADAQRRLAATDYERMQSLFKEGAVSERDVQNAEVSLRAAEANAALARKKLDESTVRAPASGVISQRAVDSGDRVKDGDLLFQLVNTGELEFEATVPSEYVSQVHAGAPVALTVSGIDDPGLGGRVARVNATVDAATRQVKVYVAVPNPGAHLVGGLYASGRVILRQVKGAISVPASAIRRDGDKSYVLTVENGHIARHDVSTGARDETASLVEITAGLAGGETVVLGTASGLRVGVPVTITGVEG